MKVRKLSRGTHLTAPAHPPLPSPPRVTHLLFLDDHFSQQSTWTSGARSADSIANEKAATALPLPPPLPLSHPRQLRRIHSRYRRLLSAHRRRVIHAATRNNAAETCQLTDTLGPPLAALRIRSTSHTPAIAPPRPKSTYTCTRARAHVYVSASAPFPASSFARRCSQQRLSSVEPLPSACPSPTKFIEK